MHFEVPEHVQEIRERVLEFIEQRVYPMEDELDKGRDESWDVMKDLMQQAKDAGLWALGHPKDIGGQGLPFMDYVYVNEIVGRSQHAMVALGTHSLQDSIMLNLYANDAWRDTYLKPLVAGEVFPSFAMTDRMWPVRIPRNFRPGRFWKAMNGSSTVANGSLRGRRERPTPPSCAVPSLIWKDTGRSA